MKESERMSEKDSLLVIDERHTSLCYSWGGYNKNLSREPVNTI